MFKLLKKRMEVQLSESDIDKVEDIKHEKCIKTTAGVLKYCLYEVHKFMKYSLYKNIK